MSNETKLLTSPDWSTAPDWAQWFAIDKSGYANWYADRPSCGGVCWWPTIELSTYSSAGKFMHGNYMEWFSSLQKRPE